MIDPDFRLRHCRYLAVHEPHEYDRAGRSDRRWWCPGVVHDHETHCCREHGHHATPHVGCILR